MSGRPDGAATSAAGLPSAVVFDLDGTLAATESMSDEVLVRVFSQLGHHVTDEDLLQARGRAFPWFVEWMDRRFAVTEAQYRSLAPQAWDDLLADGVPSFEDAMALLDVLHDAGVPLGLCTSSGRGHADRMMRGLGIADLFVATVTATDVTRHKPDPEPYALACVLLGVEPGAAVAIEDTRVGATSARAAGMRVLARPEQGLVDLQDVAHRQVDVLTLEDVRAVTA